MADKDTVGIIREQGEFFDFRPLDDKEAETVKKSSDRDKDDKDKK